MLVSCILKFEIIRILFSIIIITGNPYLNVCDELPLHWNGGKSLLLPWSQHDDQQMFKCVICWENNSLMLTSHVHKCTTPELLVTCGYTVVHAERCLSDSQWGCSYLLTWEWKLISRFSPYKTHTQWDCWEASLSLSFCSSLFKAWKTQTFFKIQWNWKVKKKCDLK